MKKILYIFLFILSFSGLSWSQSDVSDEKQKIKTDDSQIEQKHFDSEINDRYRGKQFDYESHQGKADNLLMRGIKWFFEKVASIFNVEISATTYKIIEIIIYILLFFLAGYILIRVLTGREVSSFLSKKNRGPATLQFEEEHIENLDLEKEIKNALEQKNYRLAIRFMYLKSLKTLSLQNLIEWNFEKTNSDYYREIENPGIKENFQKISYWYDHIWYGEFTLDEKDFQNAQKDFDQLNKTINYAG